jgi:hypothetical protein
MNVHPQTAAYRALIFVLRMLLELTPCPMPRKTVKHNFYSPPRLHRPLITVPPALTGAAITDPALAEPFIAAGAAVAFIRCCLLFFKGAHGLVVPPRHWYFFATEKGLSPRGYERSEIINAWYHQAQENLFLPLAKRLCVLARVFFTYAKS